MPELTRRHYQRLRFYWRGRRGQAAQSDGIDLDLAAAALIQRRESYGIVYYQITAAGEVELAAERDREVERRQPHHNLASRVAQWLRSRGRITWENIELRADTGHGSHVFVRPDVYSMRVAYTAAHINPCVHEVKVSRADFLADLANPVKRESYGKLAEAVYYAVPDGLVAPSEVPAECGLLVETVEHEFKIIKRPKKSSVQITTHTFMNLILKPGEIAGRT